MPLSPPCGNLRAMRLFISVLFFLSLPAAAEWYSEERDMMGTRVSVELWADSPAQAKDAIEAAMHEMTEVNRLMNPWDENSELSLMNREAFNRPVKVSQPVYDVIEHSLKYSKLSEGAFDVTFAAAGQHYDYRAGVRPKRNVLKEAVGKINYEYLRLDPRARTIKYDQPGLQVDLGGIAKGYAVDRAIEAVMERGIISAVISAGGDSRILGNLGDRPRTIGIRHPRERGDFVVMIPLEDASISTSGDYERFFIDEDGTRVHHILNPKTGKSVGEVRSASVLADRAIDSDALSTTIFVLGIEKGLALINRLDGVDAIMIDERGLLHYSAGLLREEAPSEEAP